MTTGDRRLLFKGSGDGRVGVNRSIRRSDSQPGFGRVGRRDGSGRFENGIREIILAYARTALTHPSGRCVRRISAAGLDFDRVCTDEVGARSGTLY